MANFVFSHCLQVFPHLTHSVCGTSHDANIQRFIERVLEFAHVLVRCTNRIPDANCSLGESLFEVHADNVALYLHEPRSRVQVGSGISMGVHSTP